jgi:hypothetical protein
MHAGLKTLVRAINRHGTLRGHYTNHHIQSDVIHMVSKEPPWLFSESASLLSSAFCNTSCSSLTYSQTFRSGDKKSASQSGSWALSCLLDLDR